MAKIVPQKKKQNKRTGILTTLLRHFLVYTGIFIFIFVIGFFFAAIFSKQNPLLEIPRNEMKKIPPDIKKTLQQQQATPSLLANIRVPILLYHYVEYVQDKKDTIRQSLDITPNTFESQIKTLQDAGYSFITAKDLGEVLDGKMQLPPQPIMLTFDDGHWDLDTVVLPILKKYHVKVTAYIIPGFIGTNSDSMTPVELQEVVDSGLVDIGAHTMHHLWLRGLSLAQVQYEVDTSKTQLEQQYHIQVSGFAYPYGAFDQQAIEVVKKAGFTTAVSTIPGIEQNQLNRFFMYRIRPGYRTGADLLTYLQQNTFRPY